MKWHRLITAIIITHEENRLNPKNGNFGHISTRGEDKMGLDYGKRSSKGNRKAQVAPFMSLVLVAVILAIGATMLIGELVYQKIHLNNVVDSALISAGADLARSLNLIRQIHFRLLLNHIRLQAMLLARGVWPSKGSAKLFAFGYIEGINRGRQLYGQAKVIAQDMPKEIRSMLFERILGGLVDEPKAFTYKQGRPGELDYEKYLDTDSPFQVTFRNHKKSYKESHKKDWKDWWEEDIYSYSWHRQAVPKCAVRNNHGKCVKYVCAEPPNTVSENCQRIKYEIKPGVLKVGEEPAREAEGERFAAYLKVALDNAPRQIYVKAQKMVLFFLYQCGKSVCPGFLPNPYAWISRLSVSPSNVFGVNVRQMPLRVFPYFLPEIPERKEGESDEEYQARLEEYYKKRELKQESKINITGGIWSGYDVRLAQ
ncbi:MAG: hypothetical protein NC928_05155 [Candidatus Omnitrophica bacterium]|nr:hypothetical protein [Candidatus Omnitrophota bacterium]